MKLAPTYQKLRGGYYTPRSIANFMASWAISFPNARVLEPSCGDGVFLEASVDRLVDRGATLNDALSQVLGVEIDPEEAAKAVERFPSVNGNARRPSISIGDFFKFHREQLGSEQSFDAIIGNPPFIRYQNFPEEHRTVAFQIMEGAGLHPNRLTNSWVPFVVSSTLLLGTHGRLAMVVPAELLQVNYAAELRYFLSEKFSCITLITFKKLVFGDIQQEVVLLLGQRDGGSHTGIQTVELEGINDLATYDHAGQFPSSPKEMDHSTEKWTMYFLDEKELRLLRKLKADPRLTRLGDVLDIDVGIVTGQNEFFVLTQQQVDKKQLSQHVRPIVGRSAHLQGSIFSNTDRGTAVNKQAPAFLFTPPDTAANEMPQKLQDYISVGEAKGWHQGFKCRIRKRWYVVPSIWVPDAFMLRQIHNFPKIVLNDTDTTCTDTIHRVRVRVESPSRTAIAAAFLNSLTFAFSEIMGRSYGGGVLELEPNEAEGLLMPLKGAEALNMYAIDKLLREGNIEAVLDISDKVLLMQGLGLSKREARMLRDIWKKLRDRRIYRKKEKVESKTKKPSTKITVEPDIQMA